MRGAGVAALCVQVALERLGLMPPALATTVAQRAGPCSMKCVDGRRRDPGRASAAAIARGTIFR